MLLHLPIAPRPSSGSMLTIAKPHPVSDFETALLAIAANDLRQPLQVIQSAHELFGLAYRTSLDRRLLQSGQNAIDRLKDQLQQLQTALRLAARRGGVKLRPVRVDEVLRQACRENEATALKNGISIRAVPTDASILCDHLLIGAVLRNLGLGIGLFIVRQAIGLLGHRIDLASTPGRGSRSSNFCDASRTKGKQSGKKCFPQ